MMATPLTTSKDEPAGTGGGGGESGKGDGGGGEGDGGGGLGGGLGGGGFGGGGLGSGRLRYSTILLSPILPAIMHVVVEHAPALYRMFPSTELALPVESVTEPVYCRPFLTVFEVFISFEEEFPLSDAIGKAGSYGVRRKKRLLTEFPS